MEYREFDPSNPEHVRRVEEEITRDAPMIRETIERYREAAKISPELWKLEITV